MHSLSRLFQPLLHQTVHVNARLELDRSRPIPPYLLSQLKPPTNLKSQKTKERPDSHGVTLHLGRDLKSPPQTKAQFFIHRQGHFLEL
jgi:hypothetical protein